MKITLGNPEQEPRAPRVAGLVRLASLQSLVVAPLRLRFAARHLSRSFARSSARTDSAFPLFACGLPALALSACVVVPMGPDGRPLPYGANAPVAVAPALPTPPQPLNLSARLYPLNTSAQAGGMAVGHVQNFLDGRGGFVIQIAGEQFNGEATRATRGSASGVANAVGSRGATLACTYTLNHPTQGTGRCTLSTGAEYQLHLSQ
ncbi:MAG: hypothetical protein JNL19_02955 [Burkholderiales bacterium]|nr:hypothetical protein [Burkholderiales bacterium]